MKNQKINILAYNYPPVGRSGSLRNLFYSDFFAKNGFDVRVFTPENPNSQYYTIDESLKKEIPKNIKIQRYKITTSNYLINYFLFILFDLIPDPHSGWRKQAYTHSKEIGDCDVLIASVPPASCLLALDKIMKENKPKIVIADFRDPWASLLIREKKKNVIRQKMIKYWVKKEHLILKKVDYILVTSELQKEWLLKDFSDLDKNKVKVVYNGVFNANRKVVKKEEGKIKIIYTGGFAESQGLDFIFDLIPKLKNIEFHFAGNVHDTALAKIRKIKNAFFHGYIPREELFKLQSEMDFGVAALTEEYKYAIPAKLFEYFECNLPVLGVLPKDGAAAQIIKKYQTGIIISPDKNLEEKLTNFLLKINKREIEKYQKNVIKAKQELSRENQAKTILNLIEKG